jgi:hypothetical protein
MKKAVFKKRQPFFNNGYPSWSGKNTGNSILIILPTDHLSHIPGPHPSGLFEAVALSRYYGRGLKLA